MCVCNSATGTIPIRNTLQETAHSQTVSKYAETELLIKTNGIMKNVNKLTLTVLIIFGVFFYSCQNQDDFSSEIEQLVAEIDTSKLIDFKGLPVNHRFETPEEDLKVEHSLVFLKQMYRKSKNVIAKRKGIYYKTDNTELPDPTLIVESAKKILKDFPYGLIPEDITQELDYLTRIEKAKQNWEMIKKDFPTLNEKEIQENIDLIDEYYEQNLDYVIFNDIAENEQEYAGRITTTSSKTASRSSCLANLFNLLLNNGKINPFHIPKAAIAIALVGSKPQTYAQEYYGETNGGNNTRGDAYRHTIWNALLADKYFTISAKNPRIAFAKAVTDTYESCTGGDADSKEMDYHNNAIGRKIWSDNTSYIKFLWWTVGLNTPTTGTIKNLVRDAVNEKSCFIVKIKNGDSPNNELKQTQTISQIKTKIDNTDSNTIVYFEGTIAPSRYTYRSVFSHWEYYDCGDRFFDGWYRAQEQRNRPPIEECRRAIYRRVRVKIKDCYKL